MGAMFRGFSWKGSTGLVFLSMWTVLLFVACADGSGDPCSQLDCSEHGVCAIRDGVGICLCDPGFIFFGQTCTMDPCRQDPCVFGVCVAVGTTPTCRCDHGYAGDFCDHCDDGFSPRGGLCVPGDPCEGDPCVFGICSMVDGNVTCTCHLGYAGELCDRCDEGYFPEGLRCVTHSVCEPNPCIHGDCTPRDGQADCSCIEGYAGEFCEDCADGWERDGLRCVLVGGDPCDPNPCGVDDIHRNVCLDSGGDPLCLCDDGYILVDDWCVLGPGDPCTPNPCLGGENRSSCVSDRAGGYICICDEGFRLNTSDVCVADGSSIEMRSCDITVRTKVSTSAPVFLRGEFNGWSETADPMTKVGGYWERTLTNLRPGDYAYKLFWREGGQERWELDSENPYTKWVSGAQNSMLSVPDCDLPLLVLEEEPKITGDQIRFQVRVLYGRQKMEIPRQEAVVTRNKEPVNGNWDASTGIFSITHTGLAPGKYGYLFRIADAVGRAAKPLFVPVWVEDQPFDWRDATIYFVLTDRFHDGDPSNNMPVSDPELDVKANWQGGDFAGVTAKIHEGYFDRLGVNCLWVSSPIMNTQGAFWGTDGHKYTGYHSYWPIATGWTDDEPLHGLDDPIEPHFGDMEAFKTMVAAAQARGIRIIVDFVANHVHTDAPLYTEHRNDTLPWFHWDEGHVGQGYVCGWERPIECWFAEYLPDFDYRNAAVMSRVMDHAIWLIQETNIDGFRLDAVKHMIMDFSSTLRGRINEEIDTWSGIRFYMVGETFTGEGEGEKQTIRDYVSPDLLDGQFDFPMSWAALAALVRHERGLDSLRSFMDGNDGYYGADAVMSTFLGNHDVPRVLSHAAGHISDMWGNGAKEQGWISPPGQPAGEDPYRRLQMAWTFLFSQQGAPLIYYGDEFGMPGAGDPDNRRFMRFDGALSAMEKATLTHVQSLGKARLKNSALRRGKRTTIQAAGDYWAYVMKDGSNTVLIVLNRGEAGSKTLLVGAAGLTDGTYRDVLSGRDIQISGGSLSLSMGRLESAIFERK